MIIGSLTSPAAAITGQQGCHQACYNQNCGSDNTSLCNSTACTAGNSPTAQACLTAPTGACDETGSTTISVQPGCGNCFITGYNYNVPGQVGCQTVIVAPTKSITFTIGGGNPTHDNVNQFCILLTC